MKNIRQLIEDTLKTFDIKCDVTLENFYKCIAVNFKHGYSDRIWIRFLITKNDKFIADLNTIELPEEHRRKGVLTSIYKVLNDYSEIEKVKITSVLTVEMKNWCIKNGLKSLDDGLNWE